MAKNAPKKKPVARKPAAKKVAAKKSPAAKKRKAAAKVKKSPAKAKQAAAKKPARKKPTPAAKKKSAAKPKKAAVKKPNPVANKKKAAAKPKGKAPTAKPKRPAAKQKPATAKGSPRSKPTSKAAARPPAGPNGSGNNGPAVLDKFTQLQHKRLLDLRDSLVDAMAGVAQDNLRSRAEGSEASAFGMHQADAGSDAYDRDFALNLLSQEQDALYEIEEALMRVAQGNYGVCEASGKKIPRARLEAIPYARLTVECQTQLEKENFGARGSRRNVRSIFGLMDNESEVETSDDND